MVDPKTWETDKKDILRQIKDALSYFPVCSVDREYGGGIDTMSVITPKQGMKTFIFRLSYPQEIRDILASRHITLIGDKTTLKAQIGFIPENYIDLSNYCTDLPKPPSQESSIMNTGQEARSLAILDIDLSHIKNIPDKIDPAYQYGLDRWYGGLLKALGYIRSATPVYAALDPILDMYQFLVLSILKSSMKIRRWRSWQKKMPRIDVIIRSFRNDPVHNRGIKPLIKGQHRICESDKNWLELRLTRTRIVANQPGAVFSTKHVCEEDLQNMKLVVSTEIHKLIQYRNLNGLLNDKTSRDLTLRGKRARKYKTEPPKSNYGLKTGRIDYNLSMFDEPEPEDSWNPNGTRIVISKGDQMLKDKLEKEHSIKFVNNDEENELLDREQSVPNIAMVERSVKLTRREINFIMDMKLRQTYIGDVVKEERIGILNDLIKSCREGRAEFSVKNVLDINHIRIAGGNFRFFLSNNCSGTLWLDVDHNNLKMLQALLPWTESTIDITKDYVDKGGELYVWRQMRSDHILGECKIRLSDVVAEDEEMTRKRRRGSDDVTMFEVGDEEEEGEKDDNQLAGQIKRQRTFAQ